MENTERLRPISWKIHPRTALIRHIFLTLGERTLDDWRNMKLENIGADRFYVKSREVKFLPETRDLVDAWVKCLPGNSPYLFPNHTRNFHQTQFSQIFRDAVGVRVRELGKAYSKCSGESLMPGQSCDTQSQDDTEAQ